MSNDKTSVWDNTATQQLAESLLSIDRLPDIKNFLRDVMTEKEIVEISSRLEAAKLLKSGEKYTSVTAKTKLSSRTVARISDWMQNGCGGYAIVLNKINDHNHIPPARAV